MRQILHFHWVNELDTAQYAEIDTPIFTQQSKKLPAMFFSGETTRSHVYARSQTAFHFEILSALWLTQKCDLLAKCRYITEEQPLLRHSLGVG